jgi:type III secretion protein S
MDALTFFRDSILTVVILSAPALLVTTLLGVLVSLLQGLFQVHDQVLGHTVKVAAMVGVLLLTGGWMQTELMSLANQMFVLVARVR